jgi:phenylalanyl-tRNA synthetase beta subunit
MSAEYAPYGLRAAADLIVQLAGGEIVGFVDEYPNTHEQKRVSVSVEKVNQILGTELTGADVADVFMRLGFAYKEERGVFDVIAPFERLDILIAEDLVEEVGRIIGYEKVPATELSPFPKAPEVNANFYAAEKVREELVAQGYSEVFISVFADTGERAVANKVDSVHPYLRANLTDGLKGAFERNVRNKELLGLKEVKLFEIGTVWKNGTEVSMLGTADGKNIQEVSLSGAGASLYEDLPISQAERYRPFSRFPFIVRDIALWCPQGTEPVEVLDIIRAQAGELLVRSELFDTFEKGEKLSLAFRLVFQSFEKTLTDAEVNSIMERVNTAVQEKGWEVR